MNMTLLRLMESFTVKSRNKLSKPFYFTNGCTIYLFSSTLKFTLKFTLKLLLHVSVNNHPQGASY